MTTATHPRNALFAGEKAFPALAACEHFAGSEKLIGKAMDLQVVRAGIRRDLRLRGRRRCRASTRNGGEDDRLRPQPLRARRRADS
jgi:hypothetical protein